MKFCYHCKQEKATYNFAKSNWSKDGFQSSCRPCKAIFQKDYRRKNPKKVWAINLKSDLKRKYNLTIAQWQALLEKQQNLCAICSKEKPLVVDHNHITGEVRGLLCVHCNTDLAVLEDKDYCLKASLYLGNR